MPGGFPRPDPDQLTVGALWNRFELTKRHRLDTREITPRTYKDYWAVCDRLVKAFGPVRLVDDLGPDDFGQLRQALAKTRGPVALGNEIQRVRMVFKFAADNGLVRRPVTFGQSFKRPSKKVLRQERHRNGLRMFEATELRAMSPPVCWIVPSDTIRARDAPGRIRGEL